MQDDTTRSLPVEGPVAEPAGAGPGAHGQPAGAGPGQQVQAAAAGAAGPPGTQAGWAVQESGAQAAPATVVGAPGVEGSTIAEVPSHARLFAVPNEAIPATPPAEGVDAVGSVPQISAQRRWARAQLSNWRLYLVRFVCAGLAVVATVLIVPGLALTGWKLGDFTRIAVVFGLLNMTAKPVLQFLALRFILNTYGVVVVVINTLLLVLLAQILDDMFQASRPLSVLLGGLLVGVLGLLLETLLGANPPVLDRDYLERNGLR